MNSKYVSKKLKLSKDKLSLNSSATDNKKERERERDGDGEKQKEDINAYHQPGTMKDFYVKSCSSEDELKCLQIIPKYVKTTF